MKRFLLVIGMMLVAAGAHAQYPERPIRVVIPFASGSSTDTITRILGEAVSKSIGQPLVIENKPGADAMLAGQDVVKAKPDGYTLLIATGSQAAIPALRKDPPYDAVKDFTPITDIGRYTLFLYVNPELPVKSLQDLINHAKANPGKINYATSSVSNIVTTVQMNSIAGVEMTAVPYKSSPQAMIDMVTGRVQVMWDPPTTGIAYVRDGKLRVLATANPTRSNLLPDVPTMVESGMPQFVAPSWMGLVGPAGMPRAIVERLNREFTAAMKRPEVIAAIEKQAFSLLPSTPEKFGAFIKEQQEVHARILKTAGVEPQ
jgi:tripartite-type tricarboxylate transporter receptor subunit TctC